MAERSARELTEIVTSAEDAQRVMAGTIELQMAPLDLAGLVRSVVERVLPGATARSIDLECEASTPQRPASGDGERLRQAFTRILGHCVGLSGPGRVQIRLEDQRTDARVDLLCPALTLSDPLREALLDDAQWPSIAGPCGQAVLDFALACRIVALHGGRLEAEALNGHGTRISATLPLALAPPG
jgi:signal transduction histidine kinase